MRLSVIVLALAGAASGSALAQTPPQPAPTVHPGHPDPQAAKPQTVKKTVCRRVIEEETTGSRVGPAPKVCKTIEVPAPANGSTGAPATERGSR
ncbi:MAG: hypothetical protein ACREBM_03955 [Sphingomicrobium sp.]